MVQTLPSIQTASSPLNSLGFKLRIIAIQLLQLAEEMQLPAATWELTTAVVLGMLILGIRETYHRDLLLKPMVINGTLVTTSTSTQVIIVRSDPTCTTWSNRVSR